MLCDYAVLVVRWDSKTHPQSCCVYEYYLCSSHRHMCLSLNTETERVSMCTSWHSSSDAAVRLPVGLDSITWTQRGRARVDRRCVRERNNHTSPAFTLSSLSWPHYASDFTLHHQQSCAVACMRHTHTHSVTWKNIKAQCSLFSNQ